MATKSPKDIAAEVFKTNPKAPKVFVCGGFGFLSSNAADLHANTSNPKKKLDVVTVFNPNNAIEDDKSGEDSQEKPINRMNKAELQAKATELGVVFIEEDTKAILTDKITEVLTSKDTE